MVIVYIDTYLVVNGLVGLLESLKGKGWKIWDKVVWGRYMWMNM